MACQHSRRIYNASLFGEIVLSAWSHAQTLVQYGRELANVVSIDDFFAADGFGAGIATRV